MNYKFIDLFAGLGGFHIALKKYGAKCVFASEIDIELRDIYEKNFNIKCHGDIAKINAEDIPKHNILCAGLPCQPFSKAGKQLGLSDKGRGDMIYEVIRILKYHKPKYFILENVPHIKKHDNGKTWETISRLLKKANYNIQDHILSPHYFDIPHKRERIFIIGMHKDYKSIHSNFEFTRLNNNNKRINHFLENNPTDPQKLTNTQINCLKTWQKFISRLPKEKPLPKFPIWSMEFGADYPLTEVCPHYASRKKLAQYKGAFGCSLKSHTKNEQLKKLPVYATYKQKKFPKWKTNYIEKNRTFWKNHKKNIEHLLSELKKYPSSWQKLEWNAGDEERDIFKHLLQFRASGIRVKSNHSIPSLVLTSTQIPIIGWKKRYLTVMEAQKLQSLTDIKRIPSEKSKVFKALGNAVNVAVVEKIVEKLLSKKNKITE